MTSRILAEGSAAAFDKLELRADRTLLAFLESLGKRRYIYNSLSSLFLSCVFCSEQL